MSTRATVYVHWVQYGDVKLYHHCDGYVSWLGMNIVRKMTENRWENVVASLLEIGWFEIDDIKSYHWDVEYVYDVYVTHKTVEFEGKIVSKTEWRVVVRSWYDERTILGQEWVEIGSGWSVSDCKRRRDDETIEHELKSLVNPFGVGSDDEVEDSLDGDSNIYNAYFW